MRNFLDIRSWYLCGFWRSGAMVRVRCSASRRKIGGL